MAALDPGAAPEVEPDAVAGLAPRPRRRIGEVLVEQGVITEEQLNELLADQLDPSTPRLRLGRLAINHGMATERHIAQALAVALGLPMLDIAHTVVDPAAVALLPRPVCERSGVLVLGRAGNALRVAAVDPTNVLALDEVRQRTGVRELQLSVITESQLAEQLARLWSQSGEAITLLDTVPDEDSGDGALERSSAEDAPVVRLVDRLIADAVSRRASDVHVEPQAREVRVRFRIDGLLRDVMSVPRGALASVVSRLKILSGLDIAERRRPQDGRARLAMGGTTVDARISTLPTLHGEKVVVRLLASEGDVLPLKSTGLTTEQLDTCLPVLSAPQGLVLITGPTGSGKTSTLYSALLQLRSAERNVVTLEDPIEIALPGIVQVPVHDRSGLTFARGLRSVLRQDPDIVMLGEIRDSETAELGLQAALTGHLVLTTLHTNGAAQALTRLVDMGIEPFLVASSLTLVIAQRLVRRPCEDCAAPYRPSPRTLSLLGLSPAAVEGRPLRRGRGCEACGGTGYRGRTGVFEVLPVTAAVRRVLLGTPDERAIAKAARAVGMASLRTSALALALRGETTLEEVLRATQADGHDQDHRCTSCGRGLDDGMLCCPWCETDVAVQGCPRCGRSSEPGWRICPWCHTSLAAGHVAGGSGAGEPVAGGSVVGGSVAGGSVAWGSAAGEAAQSRLPRVLAVDDDPSVTAWVTAALAGTATVDIASCADDALQVLSESAIDLVVLDLSLPDLPGQEVIRLLRGDPGTALVPILLLTGSADQDELLRARHAGADEILSKPVEPALLEARVTALLAAR